MLSSIVTTFIVLLSATMFNSCQKDSVNMLVDNEKLKYREDSSQSHYFEPDETDEATILGDKITVNPFSVQNMTNAWNILYPDNRILSLTPTDYYIKFKPKSASEVYDLKSDLDLTLFDFPLDYYIVKMGDYYHDPAAGDFDFYYGIVKTTYNLPDTISYDILEELYLDESDNDLVVVSMINEGYTVTEINDYIGPIDFENNGGIILPPDIDCDPPCVIKKRLKDDILINGKPQYEYYCDCSGEENTTSSTFINDCGCDVYSNDRKPGGCVTVWDANLERDVGVRNAKIVVKNTSSYGFNYPWNWFETTNTDNNPESLGCWRINRLCSKNNNIHIWVQFINELAYIRAPHFDPQRNIIPVTDYVGEVEGPNYNDISVNYPVWNDANTQTQRYWCAANSINCIAEMHDKCIE